jgi:L-asparaginase II
MPPAGAPPLSVGVPLVRVVRDGALDAVHCGHVVVSDPDGDVLLRCGAPEAAMYPRSALKPFQAAAVLELADLEPGSDELAIIAASHTGSRTHQAVVRRVLDRAGVTPAALRCPHALPTDRAALRERPEPTRLAHNCSGKHAGFLLVARGMDEDPSRYLAVDAPVQQAVLRWLVAVCGETPIGPGVDGCGAPAWRMPLIALARGFARLANGAGALEPVATAMRTHPELVGGEGAVDTDLMREDTRVIAKRGAEAVLGLAVRGGPVPMGVAIKISDGGVRALGPVAAAVLARCDVGAPAALARPAVLGGGDIHGGLEITPELDAALTSLA